ncbi:MAG: WbqC family protein [Saprospiraceae bacterium]|nr:WbqC family protein [Saprospiraceae bacterium]
MNRIAIMQPYLFPYLGYFQLIHSVDTFVLYDNLKYIHKGWVNRNRLLQVNGPPFYFNIPVPKRNLSKMKIKDIKLKDDSWKRKLLINIYQNYKRSEYFEEVFPVLERIILYKTDSLSRLNKTSIINISTFLKIETDIIADPAFDMRLEDKLNVDASNLLNVFPEIELETPTRMVVRVIALCKELMAHTYINPIGGVELYPKEDFKRNKIDILFLKMKDIQYRQNSINFHPGLSIIDVLMNCGKAGTKELLNEYTLV